MKCSAVWLSVADKLATALAPIKTAHIGQHHVSATCTKADLAHSLRLRSSKPELRGKANTLKFAGGALRDLLEEDDRLRHLELGKSARAEFFNRMLVGSGRLSQHDRHRDVLAELGMRHGETHALRHARMIHQHLVDLPRRHLLATAIDDLLQPSGDAEIAVMLDHALVAGAEESFTGEGLCVGRFIVDIAIHDVLAADHDLAGLAGFEPPAILVGDSDLRTGREPDTAGPSHAWGQRIACHLMRCLCHAVRLDQRASEDFLDVANDLWRNGGR